MAVAEAERIRLSLKRMRQRRRMTATRLAELAKVNVSTVVRIEKGARPRYGTIEALAKALDVEAEDIDWPDDPLGVKE